MKDMVKDLRTDMEKQRQAIQAVNDRPLPAPSGPAGGLHDDEILAELRAQVSRSVEYSREYSPVWLPALLTAVVLGRTAMAPPNRCCARRQSCAQQPRTADSN